MTPEVGRNWEKRMEEKKKDFGSQGGAGIGWEGEGTGWGNLGGGDDFGNLKGLEEREWEGRERSVRMTAEQGRRR